MDERNKGWFWLILLLIVAVTALYVQKRDLPGRYLEYTRSEAELAQTQKQCSELEQRIEESRRRVENLGSDQTGIEAAIRRSKDLVREGETVFRIEKAPQQTP